jgi:hypothetical protein
MYTAQYHQGWKYVETGLGAKGKKWKPMGLTAEKCVNPHCKGSGMFIKKDRGQTMCRFCITAIERGH